ncbi:hypothetical protein CHELA20_52707 [Hyphomicrobiales bacterium]|nr:hypothetical protein CHELA41_22217 [Hyphomicrobiales bacterium]CAH1682679.1 hypothetical protein CHELA20_52707 [Hyphomicrobiales bacterium]
MPCPIRGTAKIPQAWMRPYASALEASAEECFPFVTGERLFGRVSVAILHALLRSAEGLLLRGARLAREAIRHEGLSLISRERFRLGIIVTRRHALALGVLCRGLGSSRCGDAERQDGEGYESGKESTRDHGILLWGAQAVAQFALTGNQSQEHSYIFLWQIDAAVGGRSGQSVQPALGWKGARLKLRTRRANRSITAVFHRQRGAGPAPLLA